MLSSPRNIAETTTGKHADMESLFNGYTSRRSEVRPGPQPWDEMFPSDAISGGAVRAPYKDMYPALAAMDDAELRARTDALASSYLAQGVTFDFAGEERPFPLDVVPRVIAADDWLTVESGVKQRVRALEAFLADAYGPQLAVREECYRRR
jgi:uncharacterized circularly permuted ATP-grasp superfamily protein